MAMRPSCSYFKNRWICLHCSRCNWLIVLCSCLCALVSVPSVSFPPVNQLAVKAGVSVGCVKNVVVWGNHSDTQYPDITFATVEKDGKTQKAGDLVPSEWAQGSFINTVQARGSAIIEAMKKSSAASAANAAVEHVRSWMLGTAPGQFVSMAVCSSGEYGVPADLIFSFPCTCKNGVYTIVPGLDISAFGKEKMRVSWEQLQKEDQGWRAEAPEQKAE